MEPIRLTVHGDPKAQKRHRHASMGKFVKVYDPSSADKTDFYWICHNNKPSEPFTTPLQVDIGLYFARPKSHYGTGKNSHIRKATAPIFHTSKPDIDNCVKFILDALNKFFWKDDSQIWSLKVKKSYDNNPRTEITIYNG